MRLPLDRSGRATQIEDGDVVEESGAMGRSWVEDGGVSLLCTDGDGGVMESGAMGWRREGVGSRMVEQASSAWIGEGGAMESGAMGCVMESGGVRVERF
jgi:hypothetical protein